MDTPLRSKASMRSMRYQTKRRLNNQCPVCGHDRFEGTIYCWRHFLLKTFQRYGLTRRGHWCNMAKREQMIAYLYGRYKAIGSKVERKELPTPQSIWRDWGNFVVRLPNTDVAFTRMVEFLDMRARFGGKNLDAIRRRNHQHSEA